MRYPPGMAIKTVIESDLSGKTDATTVTFGLGDVWYEIDLTEEERKKLEQSLKTYVNKGRKASPRSAARRVVPETTPEEREAIRAWGREHDFEFAEYGRIPKKLLQAYDKAHGIERDV